MTWKNHFTIFAAGDLNIDRHREKCTWKFRYTFFWLMHNSISATFCFNKEFFFRNVRHQQIKNDKNDLRNDLAFPCDRSVRDHRMYLHWEITFSRTWNGLMLQNVNRKIFWRGFVMFELVFACFFSSFVGSMIYGWENGAVFFFCFDSLFFCCAAFMAMRSLYTQALS